MQLETACGNGQMTPEEYVEVQKAQLIKDELMVVYFTKNGQAEKAKICKERYQTIKTELSQM